MPNQNAQYMVDEYGDEYYDQFAQPIHVRQP